VQPPDWADPADLAVEVRGALRSLARPTAERVARHLVAAGELVDDDPEAALAQARAARALAGRVGPVREAAGIAAYTAGEWAEALAELRTARRLTGDAGHLPIIADCERALGRPERALELAHSPGVDTLPPAARVELRIVEAGARRDLGQLDAALVTLQTADLDRRTVEPWTPRLWYAYADTLLALGRTDEARDWFVATASVDEDGSTDADERVLELDGVTVLESDEPEEGETQ
jgi:tetratricopeptide (TPR) repeat protein